MDDSVIIELRGNGVVMTIYEIEPETLNLLKQKAENFGEDLSQSWFDPFFWHPKEMQQLKSQIKKKHEHRGLMCDDVSFMEIRRKGKRRKKYLVKELLGEGQLFPMINLTEPELQNSDKKDIVTACNAGSGCFARYEYATNEPFNLLNMECHYYSTLFGKALLFLQHCEIYRFIEDDFLNRGQCLLIK
jgi:hypothetical protein